ncbi:hypothetical protein [Pseudomonas sp. AU12215]|uniref:hypothetical protein n=1 Tax=Pseudomonas sp. AU12215 TaxID=1860123 RepID=UPI0007EE3745|nr:hypothetical protein [Pseudomonas sp. AU12215]OBY48708.1 hypothetical protein A9513_033015 [Pseudomonas sp. AU12215]
MDLENLVTSTIEKIDAVSAELSTLLRSTDLQAATATADKAKGLLQQLDELSQALQSLSVRVLSSPSESDLH